MNRWIRTAVVSTLCLVTVIELVLVLFLTSHMHKMKPKKDEALVLAVQQANDLEVYLADAEARVAGVKPELAKRIIWADPSAKAKTPFSIVYVHGFSASHKDTDPTIRNIAQTLGANLFLTRLKAHGLAGANGEAFGEVDAQDWVNDVDEAFEIGKRIGERVILIGMSTGATLVTNLAHQNAGSDRIAALVLLSPNFGVPNKYAKYFSGPFGRLWTRILIGKYRSFPVENVQQAAIWTTRYRSDGLVPMFDIVNHVNRLDLSAIRFPLLTVYTNKDRDVLPELIVEAHKKFGSTPKTIIDLPNAARHELAGQALAPEMIQPTHDAIAGFLREVLEIKASENKPTSLNKSAPTGETEKSGGATTGGAGAASGAATSGAESGPNP